jgi:N-formylmaleamate deformylase
MNDFTQGFASVNQLELHYYRSAPQAVNRPDWLGRSRANPPIVLLHGITDSAVCWGRVARVLRQDYELVAPDMRGHGQSDGPEFGYGSEDRAADLVGLLDYLELERPVLLGDAMGAETAIVTAALYPDRISAIILEDPPWPGRFWGSTQEERAERAAHWRSEIEENRAQSVAELVAYARDKYPEWSEEELEPWALAKQQVSPFVSNIVFAPRRRWSDYVRLAKCPALLLTGEIERGAIVSPTTAQEACFFAPQIQRMQIAGAGHSIHREQFRPYIQAVKDFLQKLDG